MIRKTFVALAIAVALALPGLAVAHEGHGKKLMGTVTVAAPDHVMVKTTEGKEQTIALNANTKLMKGKTAVQSDSLAAGIRVIITLTAKEPPTAAEIQIGAAPKSDQAKK